MDEVLFGTDPTEKIVAVETSDKDATLFIREGEETKTKIVPFVPWLATDKERQTKVSKNKSQQKKPRHARWGFYFDQINAHRAC